jgi:hypothetical protein
MRLAQQVQLASTESNVRSRDVSIILGYVAFAIVMMIVIGLDASQAGTSPDFANITVFP